MLRKGPCRVCLSPSSADGVEEPNALAGDTHMKGVCAVGTAARGERGYFCEEQIMNSQVPPGSMNDIRVRAACVLCRALVLSQGLTL